MAEKYGLPKKPDQIIQPYEYGDPHKKSTCLWLKGLPYLKPTNIVEPELLEYTCKNGKKVTFSRSYVHGFKSIERAKSRSKTFPGIAKAMAEQWAGKAVPKESETDRSVSESNLLSDPEKEIMRELLRDIGRKLEELSERIREV